MVLFSCIVVRSKRNCPTVANTSVSGEKEGVCSILEDLANIELIVIIFHIAPHEIAREVR